MPRITHHKIGKDFSALQKNSGKDAAVPSASYTHPKANAMKKGITVSQINGNKGEALISYLLSHYCLIRQVSSGTDVGVDLYCESIVENQPGHHFWIQVKASASGRFKSLKGADIAYWRRQPIPVFVFQLRLEESTSENSFDVRAINLTEEFIKNGPTLGNSLGTISPQQIHNLGELGKFVKEIVPKTIARRAMLDGVIIPVKTIENEYLKTYYGEDCHKFEKDIFTQVGRAARFLIQDILSIKGSNQLTEKRKHAERILETYQENSGKWDFHYYYGLSKFTDDFFAVAEDAFRRALNKIETDSRIDQNKFGELKQMIKDKIEECVIKRNTNL